MDEFSLGWTLGTGNWPGFFYYYYSDYQISPAPKIPGPKFDLGTYFEAQTYFEDATIIILCVFSSACLVSARRNAFVDRGDAGLKIQLSFAEPGRSGILATIPTNTQGLDSKGSGIQLSAIHARVGIMQYDLLDKSAFLEEQLYVSWDTLRYLSTGILGSGNPVSHGMSKKNPKLFWKEISQPEK